MTRVIQQSYCGSETASSLSASGKPKEILGNLGQGSPRPGTCRSTSLCAPGERSVRCAKVTYLLIASFNVPGALCWGSFCLCRGGWKQVAVGSRPAPRGITPPGCPLVSYALSFVIAETLVQPASCSDSKATSTSAGGVQTLSMVCFPFLQSTWVLNGNLSLVGLQLDVCVLFARLSTQSGMSAGPGRGAGEWDE